MAWFREGVILTVLFLTVCVLWLEFHGQSAGSSREEARRNEVEKHKKAGNTTSSRRGHFHANHAKRQSVTINYFGVIDAGLPNATNVTSPGGSLSPAAGDGLADDADAIDRIFQHVATLPVSHRKVYFPPGQYKISRNVTIPAVDGFEIYGSKDGISVLKAESSMAYRVSLGNTNRRAAFSNMIVKFLYFDGVNLELGKGPRARSNIRVSNCVFLSQEPDPGNYCRWGSQMTFNHIRNVSLTRSVFLRNEKSFGVASAFYKTQDAMVEHNVFGLDLGKIAWLDQVMPGKYWQDIIPKLEFIKTRYNLPNDQGYIESGIYSGFDRRMRIRENVFNGSPHFVKNGSWCNKDHVAYLRGFDDMAFYRNYARGWPSDPSGAVKARNGRNLIIARNYLDDTGILLYTHTNKNKPGLYMGLRNATIYGNHIVERTHLGERASGIGYHEPYRHGRRDVIEVSYAANVFEILGSPVASAPANGWTSTSVSNATCIFIARANPSEHHVYNDNYYEGTNNTVKIFSRKGSLTLQSGTPAHVNHYKALGVPHHVIPVYT